MLSFSMRKDRIERLIRKVDRATCPTHPLLVEIVSAVCPRHLEGRGSKSVALRHWLETDAYHDVIFGLVEWELPGWTVRRLALDDGLWWCALTPRLSAFWGHDEVDESHPDMTLALAKAFLVALCRDPVERPPVAARSSNLGVDDARALWW